MPDGNDGVARSAEPARSLSRVARHGAAWLIGLGRGAWLFPLDVTFRVVGLRYTWLKALFRWTPAPILAGLGQLRSERAAWRAAKGVPAYRRFLDDEGVAPDDLFPLGILGRLPETDKRSYVDRYPLLDRCVGGSVPFPGTTIDESSGSTGTPYNWIRGQRERLVAHRNIGFFARYAFGTARHDQRLLDGRLGDRFQHESGHAAARDRETGGTRHRQDPLDPRLPRADVPLPHQWISALSQASPRRGRPARVPVG